MSLYTNMQKLLETNESQGLLRKIVAKDQKQSKIYVDNHQFVNLSSNDYLGLGQDLALAKEFFSTLDQHSIRMSSSGSPLLTGAHISYDRAKECIETLFNKSALFFNSGFGANSGVIAALGTKENLIIADKLSHASMIDGMTASKGKCLRFAHNDYDHLQRLIENNKDEYDSIIVVTEAIFSMDGDKCDLQKLVDIKQKYENVYLYVDEAHSFSLYSDNGAGLCVAQGLSDKIDFIVVTFGKGLGSQGACVLCNQIARDYLINTTRSLIFSTALSPFSFEHVFFMINYMQKRNDLRDRLHKISSYIHESIISSGFDNVSSSQIIPLLTYDNDKAIQACEFFKSKGFYAMPIRHPTVPLGKARLRLSLTASLSDNEVESLANTIKEFSKK